MCLVRKAQSLFSCLADKTGVPVLIFVNVLAVLSSLASLDRFGNSTLSHLVCVLVVAVNEECYIVFVLCVHNMHSFLLSILIILLCTYNVKCFW